MISPRRRIWSRPATRRRWRLCRKFALCCRARSGFQPLRNTTLTWNFCAYMKRAWERSSAQTVYDRTSFPARYWLGRAGALDGVGQADGFEHPDEIPSDVGLIPTKAEARRTCVRVMILM